MEIQEHLEWWYLLCILWMSWFGEEIVEKYWMTSAFYPALEKVKGICRRWRSSGEVVLKVENFNFMDMVEVSGAWQFWQIHSGLTHSSQFSWATVARPDWGLFALTLKTETAPGQRCQLYIVNCYGSYNKNLLKVIKHSSLYVYYFSLLFVGRHGSFDVNYHHTWHFMQ